MNDLARFAFAAARVKREAKARKWEAIFAARREAIRNEPKKETHSADHRQA